MNLIIDIFKAIFGASTYSYQVFLTNKQGSLEIRAKDFIDAQLLSKTIQNNNIAYITPLEDVRYTSGEKGSNSYLYKTKTEVDVFGENVAQAKKNAKLHITEESVEVIEIKMPIWVNKKYYKGVQ